jgi:FKBP-type peptidyl-prolyl cis-trans isomerase FkpA
MERNNMRKHIIFLLILALAITACSASEPKTEDQKTLYAIGVLVSKQIDVFKLSPEELEILKQGLTDSTNGKKIIVEPEAYQQKIGELAQARMKVAADKEKSRSNEFLEKAAKEKGAEKSASGLIYTLIKEGTGKQAKITDVVKVHYTGTLIDGKVFDSSVKRGQPVEFPLSQVMPCWTEGVSKMKIGGKAKLVCPASLAYGDQGRPPVIPGGAALIFEIELLDTKVADTKAPEVKVPDMKGKK